MTKTTAAPIPRADLLSFEIERKGHSPKKLVNRILLVKIAAKNSVSGFIGVISNLYVLSSPFFAAGRKYLVNQVRIPRVKKAPGAMIMIVH